VQIACDVEPRLSARLELHDLRRAHRDLRRGTPSDVEMTMHLGSFRALKGAALRPSLEGRGGRCGCASGRPGSNGPRIETV
jgi:hypothetical protein